MKKSILLFVAFILAMSLATSAWAHDYWMMPKNFQPKPSALLETAFACGHAYFKNEAIPDLTKFRVFMVTPGGRELPLAYARASTTEAWTIAPLAQPGTYILGAVGTQPEFWSKTPEGYKPGRKVEVSGAVSTGMYVKSIKTFVTAGKASESYGQILGHTVEIVPQKNPTTLSPGQELPVLILFKGAPLAKAELYAVYKGFAPAKHGDAAVTAKTDSKGLASLKIDRPGIWMIYAKHEVKTPGSPLADIENYRPYMLFAVE